MAPRGLAKARDYDYSNVGKQGRRTGITLKEGRRDEHGMEELDGVFSSPEKSPVRFTAMNAGNDTMMGSEGMSMDEGEGPGPTDFLSRSASRRSPFFPPPIARSPRKSGLSGSPRRTPGLRSSPMVQNDQVPSSPTSARQRRSRVNEDTTTQSARQPLNDRRPNTVPVANGVRPKATAGDYTNDENFPVHEDDDEDEEDVNDLSAFQAESIEDNLEVHEIGDDDFGDESGNMTPDDNGNAQNDVVSEEEEEQGEEEEASPIQAASLRSQKRRSQTALSEEADTANEDIPPQSPPKRKRAGRPLKSQTQKSSGAVVEDEQRPAKKAKTVKAKAAKPAQPQEPLDPELEKVVENHINRTGPLKGRSLYILKREEPTDQAAAHTRSGRVSVRPLAYWRNERCVYGDGEADIGHRYPLSTIKEIIRTEELQPEKKGGKKRKTSSKKSKSKSKSRQEDDESDDDADPNEVDKWEAEDGVLHGYIRKWDSEKQAPSTEEEVLEVAYAPSGIEPREVKDSTFRVAKLLSQSFIGSGVVEIPPEGVKKPKNAKRMHMVFYVCYGRVQVDINGVQFTAGKGCIFQVPRGNQYSFANTYHKDARLFFTQAFLPTEEENVAAATSERTAAETYADGEAEEPESSENVPPPKPKGRGRGRAKAAGK